MISMAGVVVEHPFKARSIEPKIAGPNVQSWSAALLTSESSPVIAPVVGYGGRT
jgi:hypothetical protein